MDVIRASPFGQLFRPDKSVALSSVVLHALNASFAASSSDSLPLETTGCV